jgi:hypothetical protein
MCVRDEDEPGPVPQEAKNAALLLIPKPNEASRLACTVPSGKHFIAEERKLRNEFKNNLRSKQMQK